MQTKLQLEFLRSLKGTRRISSGFSLMELLIVVAIVGMLSAISLPKYLQIRNAARAGAVIGQELGRSKACATWLLSGGVGENPAVGTCWLTRSSSLYEGSWGEFGPVYNGLRCLQVTKSGGIGISINVSSSGELKCSIVGRRS